MIILLVRRVDHDLSEIWIEGHEVRRIASNQWVLAAAARLCNPDQFQKFVEDFETTDSARAIARDVDEVFVELSSIPLDKLHR